MTFMFELGFQFVTFFIFQTLIWADADKCVAVCLDCIPSTQTVEIFSKENSHFHASEFSLTTVKSWVLARVTN